MMMFRAFFILTFKSIRYRPIRSWLTVLGIVIAVMLVVIILALGNGIEGAVTRTLQMFGSDSIIVLPGKETNPLLGLFGGQKFKEKDLLALARVRGVRFVLPMNYGMMNITHRGETESVMIHAADWGNYVKILETSQGIRLAEGRWPERNDVREAVLGYRAAREVFDEPVRTGDEIIIKSKPFLVTGSITEIGEQMADNVVFLSMEMFRTLTGTRADAGSAFIKVWPDADINLAARQIRYQLEQQEVIRDFSVLTPEKAGRLAGDVLSVVEMVLMVIALISLIVGAVGIMNTMYTSVLERVRQIGVMKAIGASREDIFSLFLIESGIVGFTGGVLGVALGIAGAYGIGAAAAGFGIRGLFSFASIDFLGMLVVLTIATLAGLLSGMLPARQAAQLTPAEALRYE